jgi:hypothetical protein
VDFKTVDFKTVDFKTVDFKAMDFETYQRLYFANPSPTPIPLPRAAYYDHYILQPCKNYTAYINGRRGTVALANPDYFNESDKLRNVRGHGDRRIVNAAVYKNEVAGTYFKINKPLPIASKL